MEEQFSKIISELIFESPMSAREIADAIGKPYSTLMREISPHDTGAKLGAETLLQIMLITNNTEPLEYIAKKMNVDLKANNDFSKEQDKD